jgi:hypothetical protein
MLILLEGMKASWCYDESEEMAVLERVICKTY